MAVFYFKADNLIAVDAVNSPQEFMFGKRALAQSSKLDINKLTDVSVPMKDLILQG